MWWTSKFNLNLFLLLTTNKVSNSYIATEDAEFFDS